MSSHNIPFQLSQTAADFPNPYKGEYSSVAEGFLRGSGTTVPSADSGWAPGAIFQHIDGTAGGTFYVNEGTATTSNFVAIVTAGSTYTGRKTAIPITDYRVWDAIQTVIPGTAANDDLGITNATLGTTRPVLVAGDIGGAASTRYAAAIISVPDNYVAGTDITLAFLAGMGTSVADTSCTIDVQAYRITASDGLSSADICATAAQTMNSTTAAVDAFTITGTTLVPGDQILYRVAIAYSDTGNLAVMIPTVYESYFTCTTKA
jgi:hypothetical protein